MRNSERRRREQGKLTLTRSEQILDFVMILAGAILIAQWLWIALVNRQWLKIFSVPVVGASCPPPYELVRAQCLFYQFNGTVELWIRSAVGLVVLLLLARAMIQRRRSTSVGLLWGLAIDSGNLLPATMFVIASAILVLAAIVRRYMKISKYPEFSALS